MRRGARELVWTVAAAGALVACRPAASDPAPPTHKRAIASTRAVPRPSAARAPALPIPTPPAPDDAPERAARLGLGTQTTIVPLFTGPAPEAWVREAGGTEPPRVLRWPLERGRWLRGYGEGRDGGHRGIDVGDERGAPIMAAAEGLVAYAGHELSGYGNVVVILHPAGWVTVYGHASELVARPGQLVAAGDLVARVGHTGDAGGDHLHFELRRDGHKVNPLPFLAGAPASVRSAAALPLPPHVRIFRVKESDRLWKIARGSGMTPAALAELNGMGPRDVLSVGYRLLIIDPCRRALRGQGMRSPPCATLPAASFRAPPGPLG